MSSRGEHTEFVTDALATYSCRRSSTAGVGSTCHATDRPNPLGELLRTVTASRCARTSRESTLVFDGADLKSGHPALRSTLESLARQSSVVRAAHLSKKNGHRSTDRCAFGSTANHGCTDRTLTSVRLRV